MGTEATKRLRLLVHLNMQHEAARKMLGGILRFAAVSRRWDVQFTDREAPYGGLAFYRTWRPDAVVTDGRCHGADGDGFAALDARAAVFVNTPPPPSWTRPCAVMAPDDALIGRTAADFFLRKKLTSFAYIGDARPNDWDRRRVQAFRAALAAHGFEVRPFTDAPAADWVAHSRAIAKWLRALPKPCAVLAAYDLRGKHLLDVCRSAGLAVPEQVQVLGVDNEADICEQTQPSLSSVAPDYDGGGFAAAAFLDRTLAAVRGRGVPFRRAAPRGAAGGGVSRLRFGVKGVVERLSTMDTNGIASRITAARAFIRRNATADIGVDDVAAAVGVSARILQRNFRAITGATILETLQAAKLERAKDLLRKTDIPVNNLAVFCGFKSASHLKRLFKSSVGVTMGDFRRGSDEPAGRVF